LSSIRKFLELSNIFETIQALTILIAISYKKWEWQLTDESLERQSAFFNRVLHGASAAEAASTHLWPPVRLHVTHKHYAGSWRSEVAYPLLSTVRTKLYLDSSGHLQTEPPALEQPLTAKYDALDGSLVWKIQFEQPSEITGSSRLHLRFAVGGEANDADIFVTLQKLDAEGNIVYFPYHTFIDEGHVAWGWLRASQRALDPNPLGDEIAYTHREVDARPLTNNEFVDLDINIQQTATMFRRGESLQLVVQGHDFGVFGPRCQIPRAGTGINRAVENIIALEQSYLEIPMIEQRV
jgi:predicted acyl esterase